MKRRIMKKHNNTESGKHAPEYAKGIKVFEYGYFCNDPEANKAGNKDAKLFMTYSCKKHSCGDSAWYNLIKRINRTPHLASEFTTN